MNTDTPTAPMAQQKTIEEKIAEAKELKAVLWSQFQQAQEIAHPFKAKEDAARAAFCSAMERLNLLQLMKKECGL